MRKRQENTLITIAKTLVEKKNTSERKNNGKDWRVIRGYIFHLFSAGNVL